MKIKLYGIRGSLPSNLLPSEQVAFHTKVLEDYNDSGEKNVQAFLRNYNRFALGGLGTDTTSIYVVSDDEENDLIIDGGSGIRRLGNVMASTERSTTRQIDILMTHFHWDHLIGLPFFAPLYQKGVEVNFYCVEGFCETALKTIFKKPFFPVPFESLQSEIYFHTLPAREPTELNGFQVTPYRLQHPDPCWGYKIEKNGKTYSHCVDNEGERISREDLGADLPLYQNVDLCYFDAQYSISDFFDRPSWGHSTAQIGLEIAMREGIKQMIFAHHDPSTTPEQIVEMANDLQVFYDKKMNLSTNKTEHNLHPVQWEFAQEGTEFIL